MTDEEVERKAGRAQSVRTYFADFIQEAIDAETKIFQNPDSTDAAVDDAHAMIRAIAKFKARLDIATSRAKVVRGRKAKG